MSKDTAGFGVIVQNTPREMTYFLKVNEVPQATIKGEVKPDGITAKAKGYELALNRVNSANPQAPIAKGTLKIGKRTINVAAFLNKDKTVGISEDTGIAKIDFAWPTT